MLTKDIGVLNMFAVRRALSNTDAATEIFTELQQSGQIDLSDCASTDPLAFLSDPSVANSIVEAASRFCRHEPGVHVVLSGTGSLAHLEENIASIQKPPLPETALIRLREIFGRVDSVSGN